mmetsp:Transcript_166304/g.534085  ORF Transcript_166304/g.534085 Transcript_166304/m.534085 type:complete len:85 (+) Transcript_166304:35-289(+)
MEERDKAVAVLARQNAGAKGEVLPGCAESFLPMRYVLQARSKEQDFGGRSSSPTGQKMQEAWLSQGNAIRDALLRRGAAGRGAA